MPGLTVHPAAPWRPRAAGWLAIAATYFLAGKLGLSLAFVNDSATAVWPPTGIALAAVLLVGPRAWSAVFAAAVLTNYTVIHVLPAALLVGVGNTVQALLGAWLVRRAASSHVPLARERDVFWFVLAAAVGAGAGATIGVSVLWASGFIPPADYAAVWVTWWLGDATGAIVVAPVLLLWRGRRRVWSAAQGSELAVALLILAALGWVVFLADDLPLAFLCIPVCVWIAFRLGQRDAALATCLLALIAIWGTSRGLGAFAHYPPNESLLFLDGFVAITAGVCLAVGAAIAERQRGEERYRVLSEQLEHRVADRTAALEAIEARLEEAQEVAHIGSWEWTIAGGAVWWSDETYRLLGSTPGSVEPTYGVFMERIHPDDRPAVEDAHRRCIDGREPFEVEHRIVRPDGTVRTIVSKGRADVGFDGAVARVAGTAQDITDRKQLEEQRRQGQKLEAIGLLAGGVAHDFNNLLTAMRGFAEMAMTAESAERRSEHLSQISKAADRAAALTRQLLAFSRRQVLQPKVLDLNALIADVHKLLRRTIPEHIDIGLDLQPVVDHIRADPGQIEQIVLNLAVNAADAMLQGGQLRFGTSTVNVDEAWARRQPPMTPGRYTRLTVSDTGVGMSPDTQARIFEPFFTTKARHKGTGLGLATVYGTVKQSGGFVWVYSELYRGTTFEIYLPAVQAPLEAPAPALRFSTKGGSETILVAEDDEAVRQLACSVLRASGYKVIDACDGEEALVIAEHYDGGIDLLLTDVVMPGLSGHHLAERLKRLRPDVRVLYTSGYAESITRDAGLASGLPLLSKPYSLGELLQRVRDAIEQPAVA